jgi:hypothetical protein
MHDLVLVQPFRAGVAPAHHVVVVGQELEDAIFLDADRKPAGGFANAAIREFAIHHGAWSVPGARRQNKNMFYFRNSLLRR